MLAPVNCSALTALTQAGDANKMGAIRNQVGVYLHVGLGQSSSISGFSFRSMRRQTLRPLTSHRRLALADRYPHRYALRNVILLQCSTIFSRARGAKLGIGTTRIDIASFQSASQTLFDEFNGYSRCIDQGPTHHKSFKSCSSRWMLCSMRNRRLVS